MDFEKSKIDFHLKKMDDLKFLDEDSFKHKLILTLAMPIMKLNATHTNS